LFAFIMLLLMFSLAGIPPTVGFYAKLSVLQAVLGAGHVWLALVAVFFALVGTFYYIRVVKLMYFDEPQDAGRIDAKLDVSVLLSANGLAVLVLGILPQPLMQLCFYAIRRDVKDLSEHRLSSKLVYDGKLLKVRSDTVRLPNGGTAEREFVEHPGAVAVIALTEAGELVMERQYRYPLGRDMIEIPAGKIDPGEDPLATARRELKEETGYTAARWRHVATIHIAIAYSNERIEIYLAKELKHEGAKLDDEEFLEVFTLPPATALAWVREGKITDSKTVAGLFWAEKVLGGEWGGRP